MTAAPGAGPRRLVRVLFVEIDQGVIGGSTRALESLVRHVDRERYRPIVVFPRHSTNPLIPRLEALGCEVVRLGPRPATSAVAGRVGVAARFLQNLATDLVRCAGLVRAIRRLRVDLVHTNNNVRISQGAVWAAALARVPLVCHQRYHFRGGVVDRFTSRRAARVLCISETIRAGLAGQVPDARLRVVYDGVEVPETRPARREIGEAPTVAMVGRLVAWKGQHLLIQAAPLVLAQVPGARFAFVGGAPADGNDGYGEGLRDLARELGVADHCDFPGASMDVERRLREEFDVAVHASTVPEPFGLVVAEAMAAGCPVVASDAGGPAEIIEDGRSGLLFRPGDAADLADKILQVLRKPGLGEALSQAGWQRVRARFDARRTAAEVMAVWDELLAAGEGA